MRISKKKIALFVAVVMLGMATASFAAMTLGVSKTVHNLGSEGQGPFSSNDTSQVCIFCHTPHNSIISKGFLWNRVNSLETFALYTASPTLNFAKGVTISEVSKMCMSCHDGGTALNSMANPSPAPQMYGEDEIGDLWPMFGEYGPNLGEGGTGNPGGDQTPGGNLTNDHPISFEYRSSYDRGETMLKAPTGGDWNAASITSSTGDVLPFWDNGDGKKRVECLTCHDPHINYGYPQGRRNQTVTDPAGDTNLTPFLRMSNQGSKLCFTCHNK